MGTVSTSVLAAACKDDKTKIEVKPDATADNAGLKIGRAHV